jgi:hypothetical protein
MPWARDRSCAARTEQGKARDISPSLPAGPGPPCLLLGGPGPTAPRARAAPASGTARRHKSDRAASSSSCTGRASAARKRPPVARSPGGGAPAAGGAGSFRPGVGLKRGTQRMQTTVRRRAPARKCAAAARRGLHVKRRARHADQMGPGRAGAGRVRAGRRARVAAARAAAPGARALLRHRTDPGAAAGRNQKTWVQGGASRCYTGEAPAARCFLDSPGARQRWRGTRGQRAQAPPSAPAGGHRAAAADTRSRQFVAIATSGTAEPISQLTKEGLELSACATSRSFGGGARPSARGA